MEGAIFGTADPQAHAAVLNSHEEVVGQLVGFEPT